MICGKLAVRNRKCREQSADGDVLCTSYRIGKSDAIKSHQTAVATIDSDGMYYPIPRAHGMGWVSTLIHVAVAVTLSINR